MFDGLSPRLRVKSGLAVVALLVIGLGGAHCSAKSGAANEGQSCLANPTQCPGGQTCWPTSATTFACITSQPSGAFGDSCVETISAATCGDGLFCDATDPTGEGQCTQYCSAA